MHSQNEDYHELDDVFVRFLFKDKVKEGLAKAKELTGHDFTYDKLEEHALETYGSDLLVNHEVNAICRGCQSTIDGKEYSIVLYYSIKKLDTNLDYDTPEVFDITVTHATVELQ